METDPPLRSAPNELNPPDSNFGNWKFKLFRVKSMEKAPLPAEGSIAAQPPPKEEGQEWAESEVGRARDVMRLCLGGKAKEVVEGAAHRVDLKLLEIDTHMNHLRSLCRICGLSLTKAKGGPEHEVQGVLDAGSRASLRRMACKATGWPEVLLKVFKVDVTEDLETVHPPFFCDRCWKAAIRGGGFCCFSRTRVPQWRPHSAQCPLCYPKKASFLQRGEKRGRSPRAIPHLAKRVKADPRNRGGGARRTGARRQPGLQRALWVKKITRCGSFHLSAALLRDPLPADFLRAVTCQVCDHLLADPVQSPCGHLFCRACILKYGRALGTRCPACALPCPPAELVPPAKAFLEVLRGLVLRCPRRDCEEGVRLDAYGSHRCLDRGEGGDTDGGCWGLPERRGLDCYQPVNKGGRPRQHLLSLSRRAQKYRLKELKAHVRTFAEKEEGGDVKSVCLTLFLLALRASNEHRQADELEAMMQGRGLGLHPTVCLAIRVNTFLSCSQYHKMYRTVKATSGRQIFQPLQTLRNAEKELLPGYHPFEWQPALRGVSDATSVGIVDGLSGWAASVDDSPADTIARRFRYDVALVSALKDLEEDIVEGLRERGLEDSACTGGFSVVVKESCDGMGDVSEKHGGGPALPEKVVRFSFTVMSVSVRPEGADEDVTLFLEPRPNSELSCRPLCLMFADESDHEMLTAVLGPVSAERDAMKESRLILPVAGLPRSFRFHFRGTGYDEKMVRELEGLEASGSAYICTLCDSTRAQASRSMVLHAVTRSHEENAERYEVWRTNPYAESADELRDRVKGVSAKPFLETRPTMDALHCEIGNAAEFYKLFQDEIGQVHLRADGDGPPGREERRSWRAALDEQLRKRMKLKPVMRMNGNYARRLMTREAAEAVCELVPSEDRRRALRELMDLYLQMKPVWRSTCPARECRDQLLRYGFNSQRFADLLAASFRHRYDGRITNYLHKTLAHVPEIVERDGSVGAWASEGNESGNKLFRRFRKMNARQSKSFELEDILKHHWLYTSRHLQRLMEAHRNSDRALQATIDPVEHPDEGEVQPDHADSLDF